MYPFVWLLLLSYGPGDTFSLLHTCQSWQMLGSSVNEAWGTDANMSNTSIKNIITENLKKLKIV